MRDKNYLAVLEKTLQYSRKRDYIGYDKADGMSSEFLQKLPIDNKWINLIFQESVKRAPINIRPLLLVEQRPNSKGTALFILANLHAHEFTGEEKYLEEAKKLLDRMEELRKEGYSGFCLGSNHETQGLGKKSPIEMPDVVDTSYAVKALLLANEKFSEDKYAERAYSTSEFVFEDLDYIEDEEGGKIKYKPFSTHETHTFNANALGARLLIDLYSKFSEERFREASMNILDYIASHQRGEGGWMYTDPPSASHLSMDNYHNGFIIESLLRYQEVTGSNRFEDPIQKSLHFYKNVLYNEDGSPNWDENSEYPKDTHAVAQGIIVFNMDEDMGFSKKILDWTLDNLYAGDGRFYYQKKRFYTKKFTLMRWCQAWMAYAISEYLIGKNH